MRTLNSFSTSRVNVFASLWLEVAGYMKHFPIWFHIFVITRMQTLAAKHCWTDVRIFVDIGNERGKSSTEWSDFFCCHFFFLFSFFYSCLPWGTKTICLDAQNQIAPMWCDFPNVLSVCICSCCVTMIFLTCIVSRLTKVSQLFKCFLLGLLFCLSTASILQR